jgi:hypothetical protein
MAQMTSELKGVQSALRAQVVKAPVRKETERALGWWRLRNTFRWGYIWGLVAWLLARAFTWFTKVPTVTSELRAHYFHAPTDLWYDLGVLCRRVVTTAGVGYLVDDWDDSTTDITNMNYHACGTDNTAESSSDTALGAESTTITDRVAGTKSQPASNQLKSEGTQSFTGAGAIVEHGLFSVITEGAGVLWDRSVFAVLNVGNGDSLKWTLTVTINAGG